MSGIQHLPTLLATMRPRLADADYVFCTFSDARLEDLLHLSPLGVFKEAEGISLVIAHATARRHGIPCPSVMRLITLEVHSSLEAVGFTAVIAARLSAAQIGANVVAAFHHDHVFVPAADADRALQILKDLQAETAAGLAQD